MLCQSAVAATYETELPDSERTAAPFAVVATTADPLAKTATEGDRFVNTAPSENRVACEWPLPKESPAQSMTPDASGQR